MIDSLCSRYYALYGLTQVFATTTHCYYDYLCARYYNLSEAQRG